MCKYINNCCFLLSLGPACKLNLQIVRYLFSTAFDAWATRLVPQRSTTFHKERSAQLDIQFYGFWWNPIKGMAEDGGLRLRRRRAHGVLRLPQGRRGGDDLCGEKRRLYQEQSGSLWGLSHHLGILTNNWLVVSFLVYQDMGWWSPRIDRFGMLQPVN